MLLTNFGKYTSQKKTITKFSSKKSSCAISDKVYQNRIYIRSDQNIYDTLENISHHLEKVFFTIRGQNLAQISISISK